VKPNLPAYIEVGRRRVFAGAIEWPGWCRSGRDQDAALGALVAYGPRYASALGAAGQGFEPPADPSALDVVERLRGDATTDFGAPGVAPAADDRPLSDADLERLVRLLKACWKKLDRAANAARGKKLQKGPRGGGRELDAIASHLLAADVAYLSRLGARFKRSDDAETKADRTRLRKAFVDALVARAHGVPPDPSRRTTSLWKPRYAVRRSAWHALDHAWEIEDRAALPRRKA
jgi:hypothetical protein